ncbi:hypothetical protein EAO69_30210 [Streptomyces sp. me109]|uniref:hypothetical protein n=1 Tax=Streptomyces sp. me109 TaxID=1827853 RepID=UPI0011CE4D3F|nr:hypothetical protein [Streptomyces sp. me109]TXS66099.1 hypothetical protein EAO69_30210 [Streptomyces sp. me109]
MFHRKYFGALGVAAMSVALAACSNSATPTAAKPVASHSSAASSPASSSPPPQAAVLTKAQLTSALLPLSQMPAGWSTDSSSSTGDKTFCNYRQPHKAQVQVSRTFQKGGGLTATVASVGIRQYASASDAAESFAAMEKALESCHKETYQGSVLKYSPMSVDKLGDRSLGVRIDSDAATLLQQFALDGPTLINVGTGGMADAEADTATKLLHDQVDRYEAAARK